MQLSQSNADWDFDLSPRIEADTGDKTRDSSLMQIIMQVIHYYVSDLCLREKAGIPI